MLSTLSNNKSHINQCAIYANQILETWNNCGAPHYQRLGEC